MAKRVVLVHGWADRPNRGWFLWLDEELSKRGFEIIAPILPDRKNPRREAWVNALKEAVGTPDEETYFVGHSAGCQAVLRFIAEFPDTVVGPTVFVAGSLRSREEVEDDPERLARWEEWHGDVIDFEKVRKQIPKSLAVFSDDDPWVPVSHSKKFKERLGSEIVIEQGKGHFSFVKDGIDTMPVVFDFLIEN